MKRLPNYSQKDYSIAYDKFENFCINNVDAKVIGFFGEIKNPPISDLDAFICISDNNFIQNKKKIISFIASNNVLSYVMEHMPVIIPQSLLPSLKYFHTMYNLTITYNIIDYVVCSVSDDYLKMLNFFWTLTIITRNYDDYKHDNSSYDIRKQLLLLKNLHQSASNLVIDQKKITKNYLERSNFIRNKFLIDNCSSISIEIRQEMLKTHEDIISMLNEISYPFFENLKNNTKLLNCRIRLTRNFCLERGEKVFFETKRKLSLNDNIYDMALNLYSNKTNNNIVRLYLNEGNKAKRICKRLNIDFPFYVKPFGISPGKSSFKEQFRKIVLNCLDRLKII